MKKKLHTERHTAARPARDQSPKCARVVRASWKRADGRALLCRVIADVAKDGEQGVVARPVAERIEGATGPSEDGRFGAGERVSKRRHRVGHGKRGKRVGRHATNSFVAIGEHR